MRERINQRCAFKTFLKEIVSKITSASQKTLWPDITGSDATTGKYHLFVMESDIEEIAVGVMSALTMGHCHTIMSRLGERGVRQR